ncbi:MAG: VPLPA-CTERM sorting domain-containing protein [Nitrosomonadaceae bacterium]
MEKSHLLGAVCAAIFSVISIQSHASVVEYESKSAFAAAVGGDLVTQDWSTYPANTLLDGQTLDGIKYNSTNPKELVVGSSHGGGWLLGYNGSDNRYSSFGFETISFEFEEIIDVFGISLSQGNQNQGNRYVGYALWSILVDGTTEFFSRADYGLSDRSGEAFLGLDGLNGASRIDVRRIFNTNNIVWNIRDISYVTAIPIPAAAWLFGSGLLGLIGIARRKKST